VWEGTGARTEARDFCELWGVEGTVLVDEQGELAERLGIRGVPANVFVDSDGTVTAVGGATPADLEAAARQLLGPGAAAVLAPQGEPAAGGAPGSPGAPGAAGPGAGGPGVGGPGVDEDRIERHMSKVARRKPRRSGGPEDSRVGES